ncbi:UNVERIFIED_CONTAM: Retrovirus-related Pol polyprotein from transposon TNT 1-94 [Sesamum latifolium]|uniref:Retrovirus-related Pol polyprotein from transposon TNT 1-94 n=1 Tax=Sesamum latifolium TaxID=2727402 RepID=A0AAW2X4C8_9LAMI
MARSMLKGKGVPNLYWTEAVHMAMCILTDHPQKHDESKRYRLLDPSTRKVIVSRDVIFDESSAWNFNEKQIVEFEYYHDPLTSQAGPSQVQNDESQRIGDNSNEESHPRKTRPLSEIYESTEQVLFASEPPLFEDASKDERWTKAMNEEMSTVENNKTWELVDLPKGKKTIRLKWIFKIKFNQDGSIQKYKARLVAKGISAT